MHGDYHPANMIFQGDELVAVCDFDMVQEAPVAFDLAYFLYRAATAPTRSGGGPSKLDRNMTQAFLRGYGASGGNARPPSRKDIASELRRFAWFNALLMAHNQGDEEKLEGIRSEIGLDAPFNKEQHILEWIWAKLRDKRTVVGGELNERIFFLLYRLLEGRAQQGRRV